MGGAVWGGQTGTWKEEWCLDVRGKRRGLFWRWVAVLIKAAQSGGGNVGPNEAHYVKPERPLESAAALICCSLPEIIPLSQQIIVKQGRANNPDILTTENKSDSW